MWTNLGKAIITALVVIAAAELLARTTMGRVEFAHSYDESRNPNYRRAWPAFTEPRPREPNEKLIIVISNSQGFAHELKDADHCYTEQLEERLNQNNPDKSVTVANWSLGGVSGPEMLLLVARAIDHNPDMLLLITHSNPFSHHRLNNPLSFYLSDAGQFAYTQPIRNRLPGWFIRQHRVYDPATLLEAHSGLIQCRSTFIEQRHRRWHIASAAERPRRGKPKLYHAPEVRDSGDKMLRACVDVFRDVRPDSPVLLVNMPLCQPKWTEQAWPRLQSFGERMDAIAQKTQGVTAIDATEAIEYDLFLTHTHLSAQGHAQFADYLLPIVEQQLDFISNPAAQQP